MENELLDLVDDLDQIIGSIDREEVYRNMIHNVRVIGIFIVDDNNSVLVQTRSKDRVYCPSGYDFSVAGHVHSGENYEEAAHREAIEELGIDLPELKEFLYCRYPNDYGLSFFSKYYIARCNEKTRLVMNTKELSKIEFMSCEEIRNKLENNPHMFKSDYLPAFNEFCKSFSEYI